MRKKQGQAAIDFSVVDIDGNKHALRHYRGKRVLLSFFRDPSCPFCNVRLYEITQRHALWQKEGLVVLAFFQASPAAVSKHASRHPRPFPIIPDPTGQLFQAYGVESAWRGVLRALVLRMPSMVQGLMRSGSMPAGGALNGQLPADFLLDESGRITSAYYGRDIGDHMPLSQIERSRGSRGNSLQMAVATKGSQG